MAKNLTLLCAIIAAAACACPAPITSGQTPAATKGASVLSAAKSDGSIVITSTSGALTYKAVIDPKSGGDIAQFRLPADGDVVARELNDLFFLGQHGDQFTLRGWSGRSKFVIACSADLVLQTPDEVVVRVDLLATGTFKILATDEALKANLHKAHVSYKDKTLDVRRTYTFKSDRVVVDDQVLWLHPDLDFKTVYFTPAFMPGVVQGPARLSSGTTTASFNVVSSGGKRVPDGITYPCTAANFLKNGYKVSVRTSQTSFDVAKSDFYFYEKPWQQDWNQLSGFMYRLAGYPAQKPVAMTHEVVFAKAAIAEMPPIVTIASPPSDARWMDEKGEVARYKLGDTIKLIATAINSDGSPVPDDNITWEIHIDPWWKTPAVTLRGNNLSYTLPAGVANEQDKATSKDRNLLAVISVTVRGKNGTEAVEPFAMLVGRPGQ